MSQHVNATQEELVQDALDQLLAPGRQFSQFQFRRWDRQELAALGLALLQSAPWIEAYRRLHETMTAAGRKPPSKGAFYRWVAVFVRAYNQAAAARSENAICPEMALLTLGEVARRLQVKLLTVHRLVNTDKLHLVRVEGEPRITLRSFQSYLNEISARWEKIGIRST